MLTQQDYNCIGVVAKHCDYDKLCIAERHALESDMENLYCDFWYEIKEYWDEVDAYDLAVLKCNGDQTCINAIPLVVNYAEKKALIYGGAFENCSGKTRTFEGIRNVLIYYSYARYIFINSVDDTPNGLVKKTNDFSIQLNDKELSKQADMYRSMGYDKFKKTEMYLCNKRETFTDFNSKNCVGCGCSCDKCGGFTKNKGYGIRGGNITKKL